MSFETSPREVCFATASMLSEDSCLGDVVWFHQNPGPEKVFDKMPCGVLDFDLGSPASFNRDSGQGLKVTFTMMIDLFYPITEADQYGLQADEEIWRLWWCLVRRLMSTRYYGKTVAEANISGGNVEGIPVDTRETGILARWAWLNVDVAVFVKPWFK